MKELPNLRRQSDILSTSSSAIKSCPSITSAYIFGSYAKGTAHQDSDVDIAIFFQMTRLCKTLVECIWTLRVALNKQVSVCPPDAFVEKIKKYWVPINVGTKKSSFLLSSSAPPADELIMPSGEKESKSSTPIRARLRFMEKTCKDLIKYINDLDSIGGVTMLNSLLEDGVSIAWHVASKIETWCST